MKRWTAVMSRIGWIAGVLVVLVWLGSSPEFSPHAAAQRGDVAAKTAKTEAKTKPAKTAAGKTKAPPKNPLGRLIRGLFPAKKPARIVPKRAGGIMPVMPNGKTPGAKPAGNGDPRARDHIDRRAPFDQADSRRLDRAERFIEKKNWKFARILLQRLLDRAEDSLVRTSSGKWVSIRDEATRLLGKFPSEQQDAYHLQYGKPAEQLLATAIEQGDMRKVVDVATRYFRTTSGKRAANHLASWYLDRGEYGMSARWMRRLIDVEADFTTDPKWMLKAAVVFRNAGDTKLSERLLKSVEGRVGTAGVSLGGQQQNPRKWLNNTVLDHSRRRKPLDEWPVFFGSPSRNGTVAGGEPLLLPRWSHPTTFSHAVRRKMETLVETLSDSGRAMIPVFFPLTVDDKIVYRTLRGVTVVDAVSGKTLWETREGISPEMIISGRGRPTSNGYSRFGRARFRGGNSSSRGDSDPLTGLLFRNGTYGNISSDGKRLFVIESHAVLSNQQPGYNYSDPEKGDAYRRSWKTNKLAAYDLNSGRPLWEVGGRKRNEPFDLPLAGHYFFGTPVADRGELFLVGEKDMQIRVFALDAKTGAMKWSQLIAYSDAKISRDVGRRWFTSQVSVKDGMLICPTTVGWLVAVDRLNHSVLWAHRYAKTVTAPRNRFGANTTTLVQPSPLNGRWSPSAPVMTRGYVVYTPSEDASICCLRMRDGKPVWKIPKADSLYLAGAFGDRVVLVGKTAVTAVSLTTGTTAWTIKLPAGEGRPSGMGVAVEGTYHLPLSSGQLYSIDLATGKTQSRRYLANPAQPLGNLAMYRGMLLSLNPFGMTSFEQRAAIVAKIKQRKAQTPDDAWALLREVEILHLQHDFVSSLTLLRKIRAEGLPAEMTARYRQAMLLSLTAVIRGNLREHEAEVKEMEQFVSSADEKLAFRRLAAERHDARGELESAFDIYRKLAAESSRRTILRADNARVHVALDSWLTGRVRDVYHRADAALKQRLDARIAEQAATVPQNDSAAENRFCAIYGFHLAASPIQVRLAETYASSGKFGRAEQLLLGEARRPQRHIAATAVARLADLLRTHGFPRDANKMYRRLQTEFSGDTLADGRTVKQFFESLRENGVSVADPTRKPVTWAGTKMTLQRSGRRYTASAIQQLFVSSGRSPYFRNHQFQIDPTQQQLSVVDTESNSLNWLAPLRSRASGAQNTLASAAAADHTMFLVHRGVVHCLSPVDRRTLWTRPLESRNGNVTSSNQMFVSNYSPSSSSRSEAMTNPRSAAMRFSLLRNSAAGSLVPVANGQYVGVYGRRKFTVLDAMTGNVMWEYNKLPPGTRFFGVRDCLFVVPADSKTAYAVRPVDGKRLELKDVPALVASAIDVVDDQLLQINVKTASFLGITRESMTLGLSDPFTGKSRWSRSYKSGALISRARDGSLIVMAKDGRLEIINPADGAVQSLAPVAKEDRRSKSQVYAITDRDTLVLILNGSRMGGRTYYSGGMPTVYVHGLMIGYDRITGKQLWKQKLNNRNLVLQHLTHSPVLAFSSRKYIRMGRTSYQTMRMMAIDKRSGERLIDVESPTNQYYRALKVNVPARYIEFESYNHRMRLNVVDRKPGDPATAKRPAAAGAKESKGG